MNSQESNNTQSSRRDFSSLRLARAGIIVALSLFLLLSSSNAIAAEDSTEDRGANVYDQSERSFYASMGMGLDFSRGDYGTDSMTNSLAVPVSLKLEWEPITFRVSIPFITINGSDGVIGGTDGPVSGGGSLLGSSVRYGLGDVVTGLTYSYYAREKWVPNFDISSKVKIPTAGDGLGTDKTDVTLQLELSKGMGPVSVFGSFGYRFKGGGVYEDILLASSGVGVRISSTLQAGLAYDWRESAVAAGDSHEVSPYVSIRTSEHFRVGPYAVLGLSEQAPDWGVGSSFTYVF